MSIDKYNEKRDFTSTSEPKGIQVPLHNEPIFVVQKHAASHLHYDFRLEIDGVLKSWAVPKGPSLNPEVKRLAMMVEDHPYSYKDFEGSIPKGNYGAGNVIVWDNGTFKLAEKYKGDATTKLKADLHKGHLYFILKGKKLKGEFSLIKIRGEQENTWLLIKKEDKYSTSEDILEKNRSILSNTTLEALEKKSAKNKIDSKKASKPLRSEVAFIKPMLANGADEPFDNEEWLYENKYDGYRAIAVKNNQAHIFSRNRLSYTAAFKQIAEELNKIEHNVVLDGEIVVEDAAGNPSFQLLQNYIKTKIGTLKYFVFDILNLDGNDVTQLSLLERKELLKLLLKKQKLTNVVYAEHTLGKGSELHKWAIKNKTEGIMAKKILSTYTPGQRTNEWLKIKISLQEEAIVVGITESKKNRSYFGALLLGQYEGNNLKFIGKCGTGFKEETLKELYEKFKPQFIEKSPLKDKVPLKDTVQWIKPKFVAQIKFTEWTKDNHLRHPVYLGLRNDKSPKEVSFVNEREENYQDKISVENDYELKIGKTTLHLTNQNKVYFPKSDISKGEILNYYSEVAEYILPYLKNRPQSMNRFPNGIEESNFYHKDVDVAKIPSWLKTEAIYSESNKAKIDYLICNDKATLLYMANLGCIDINPWNSTIKKIENPDWMVIDIDPEKEEFQEVIKTALVVKDVLEELETACYCKTSGATGLHVFVPLGAKYNYDTVKIFAELIAHEVQARLPETTTLERSIKKRKHKIYIDYLQNRTGQTLAAPYSVRPQPGATVSTPLDWSEVNKKLSPSQFTIKNVIERFKEKGDLWKPVLGKGADLNKIMKKLEERN